MRQKIYGIFSNVNDAKQAFGSIKKTSFNQADLTIIFADNQEKHDTQGGGGNYEFAVEYFRESVQDIARKYNNTWPGIQTKDLAGIGKIQIGSSNIQKMTGIIEHDGIVKPSGDDLEIVAEQVKAKRIVAIIEAESELVPQVRLILESNGAEILSRTE
jgi:hypothetical protein